MALSALNIARTKQHSPVSSSRKALQDAAQQVDDDATATTTPGEQEEAAVSAEVQALQKCAEAYARYCSSYVFDIVIACSIVCCVPSLTVSAYCVGMCMLQ